MGSTGRIFNMYTTISLLLSATVLLGGSVLGLVLYFLATQAKPRYNGYQHQHYNQYGYGYGESEYVDRMDQARSFDILGMIGNALNMYQQSNQESRQEQRPEYDYQ